MQQRLLDNIPHLAKKYLSNMKKSLWLFPLDEDKKTIEDLEAFLTTENLTTEEIVSRFDDVKNKTGNKDFKNLSQQFIFKVTSLQNTNHNIQDRNSILQGFLSIPSEIIDILFDNWGPLLIKQLAKVCKNFHTICRNYLKNKPPIIQPNSTNALITPISIPGESALVVDPFTDQEFQQKIYTPSFPYGFLNWIIYLTDPKTLLVFDLVEQKVIVRLPHPNNIAAVESNALGDKLIVMDVNPIVYVWNLPNGEKEEEESYHAEVYLEILKRLARRSCY